MSKLRIVQVDEGKDLTAYTDSEKKFRIELGETGWESIEIKLNLEEASQLLEKLSEFKEANAEKTEAKDSEGTKP